MGLFSKKSSNDDGAEYRGGCSDHDMHGPARGTFNAASKDATDHAARMHGGNNPHGYVERRK